MSSDTYDYSKLKWKLWKLLSHILACSERRNNWNGIRFVREHFFHRNYLSRTRSQKPRRVFILDGCSLNRHLCVQNTIWMVPLKLKYKKTLKQLVVICNPTFGWRSTAIRRQRKLLLYSYDCIQRDTVNLISCLLNWIHLAVYKSLHPTNVWMLRNPYSIITTASCRIHMNVWSAIVIVVIFSISYWYTTLSILQTWFSHQSVALMKIYSSMDMLNLT